MPLYEYRCTDCEATLEAIQAFAAPPLEECPECGRSSLKKLLSAPAFQFKGSGWYVNDYARKDKSPAGVGESDRAAANGNGSESNGKSAAKESSADSGKKAGASSSSGKSDSSKTAAAS